MPAPDAIPKILVTGPESSGKTTLSKQLAKILGGTYVREYAREYLEKLGREYAEEDLVNILRGQLALEAAASDVGAELLVCDTGPEVIYVWSQEKYGRTTEEINSAVADMDYNAILLCWPEFTWESDPLREHPDQEDRIRLFNVYLDLLRSRPGTRKVFAWLHPSFRSSGNSQLGHALLVLSNLLPVI